jgi:hypothetical protein
MADDNILDLQAKLQIKKRNEVTFVLCPCNPEDMSPMLPVVIHTPQGVLITHLVCPECE